MNKYYIDMSIQSSSDLLRKRDNLNCNLSESYNSNSNLVEGFGNFGRVNLEKCCPIDYMWSEVQKKCVKICSNCSVAAYGKINYEFLHNHGDEFMSFTVCEGDATGSYDYDELNKRYESKELLDQYDMNIYMNQDENAGDMESIDPWASVVAGTGQSVRTIGTYAADAAADTQASGNNSDNNSNNNPGNNSNNNSGGNR